MPSFQGNPFKNFFKRILQLNQSSNTGVDATTRSIQTGDGVTTSVSLSDDVLAVQPQNDNTTGTFLVKNKGGNNILTVDTSGTGTASTATGRVLLGTSQVNALTQYAHFGTVFTDSSGFTADNHFAVPFISNSGLLSTGTAMGSSTSSSFNDTNPASSLTLTASAHYYAACYWYVIDNITIDAVTWWHGADTATGEDVAAHLMGYDVVSDNSSTSGNLSNGTVLADAPNITNAGEEQIYYQSMTVQSADVDAGKVILFTFASDTVNSDYTINATVKYHIR